MKQTSIEWLIEEMMKKGFFKESVTLTNIDHLQYKAEEMYKQETTSNCSQPVTEIHALEIPDEEIEKAAKEYDIKNTIWGAKLVFVDAIKWYKEQLKNK